MSSPTETLPFRYMTFNLCNIPQMDKDNSYNGLRFNERLRKIVEIIRIFSPDAIGFQEVRDYSGGTAIADLWQRLVPLGYRLESQEASPHEFAVYNTIAYKSAKLWPKKVISWWNSSTPSEVSCSYGNGWPRAVLAIEFVPIKQTQVHQKKQGSGEVTSFSRAGPDYSSPSLLLVNSHLGIGTSHPKERLFSNQTTLEKIRQIVGSNPMFVVSLGDFNSFPDGEFYKDEMHAYKSNEFIDAVTASPLKNQDGIPISGTFIGYSPDKFKCPNERFADSLEHIFYRVFNQDNNWSISVNKCFASTLTTDQELDRRKIQSEQDLLIAPDTSPLRDKYPSDHLPVILDFQLNRKQAIPKTKHSTQLTQWSTGLLLLH